MNRFVRARSTLLLSIMLFSLMLSIQPIGAGYESTSEVQPLIGFEDLHNGTRKMRIDYQNGTMDCITENLVRKTASLRLNTDQLNKSLSASLNTAGEAPAPTGDPPHYVNKTETIMAEHEVLMGFTYDLIHERFAYSKTYMCMCGGLPTS